jgi:hypothetical protein
MMTAVSEAIAISLTMTHGRAETLLDDLKVRSIGYQICCSETHAYF